MPRFVILHSTEGGESLDVQTQEARSKEEARPEAVELAAHLLGAVDNAGYETGMVLDLLNKMRHNKDGG